MKILYAVQGTGNGHISRAAEIIPAIRKRAEVDVLISGMHTELSLDCPVKYRMKGLGFKFGKKGGVDYFNTWWHGDINRFLKEIKRLDLSSYDLVINDFEPVSAWAARRQHIPCVGLSNQCVLLDQNIPKPTNKKYRFAKSVIRKYAPTDISYGFHYQALSEFIDTPIVRTSLRELTRTNLGHYVVYLPSFNDKQILNMLTGFPDERWVVFSKHSRRPYRLKNVEVHPINDSSFLEQLASCAGVLCGAGFATTSEVLFLGKKLLVIPMKNQYEQQCNALALESFGIPVIKSLKKKWVPIIHTWLKMKVTLEVNYADHTQLLVDRILTDFANQSSVYHDGMMAVGEKV